MFKLSSVPGPEQPVVIATESLNTDDVAMGSDTPLALPLDGDWQIETTYVYNDVKLYLEILQGQQRKGTDKSGKAWSVTMPDAYGFIPGTKDADGEDVDIYLHKPFTSDGSIFVIDQIDPATKMFDEHKVMVGYPDQNSAADLYKSVFSDGSGASRLGAITAMSWDQFKSWLNDSAALQSPVSSEIATKAAKTTEFPVAVSVPLPKLDQKPYYNVSLNAQNGRDFTIFVLSGFQCATWGTVADDLIRAMYEAERNDSFHFMIASYGGEVDLAARLASAMRITKASVITTAIGGVASAGCLLWCEGRVRQMTEGSYMMQHMSSNGASGHTGKIKDNAAALSSWIQKVVFKRAVSIGLLTDDEVLRIIDSGNSDVYLTAQQVVDRTGATLVTANKM